MPKVRLQHNGNAVSIELDPDGSRVRNHNPLRFRISHDVTVNTGVNTWFMSRQQLEQLNLDVLTEILEAKQPGGEEAVANAEKRVAKGQQDLVRSVQEISRLTHPDVMMLIDMRQNPNQYVNGSSAFANMFNALARKVMDLSFYATLNGPYPEQQRKDFIKTTGAVTRGMDQFIYCRPNASTTNPYVNFSVIPIGQNYEDVRFPTHYDTRTQTKEKIPKTRFTEIYAYYVNELFDCYRRYLRMLGVAEVLPGETDEVSADVLAEAPGNVEDSDSESEDDGPADEVLDDIEEEMLDSMSGAPADAPASPLVVNEPDVSPSPSVVNEPDAPASSSSSGFDLKAVKAKQITAKIEEMKHNLGLQDRGTSDKQLKKSITSSVTNTKGANVPLYSLEEVVEALLKDGYYTKLKPTQKMVKKGKKST